MCPLRVVLLALSMAVAAVTLYYSQAGESPSLLACDESTKAKVGI